MTENREVRGATKIKLKKANNKKMVTVRRVIIFLNISRHPTLITLLSSSYKTLTAVATATAAIVVLTPPVLPFPKAKI